MKVKIHLTSAFLLACFVGNVYAQKSTQALTYPETTKGTTIDNYFGNEVADPYRWLEDDRSSKTEDWVKSQNKVTQGYLDHIPYRDQIKDRMTKLWNYEKYSSPTRHGDYDYFYKNDGLQNQYVLYRQKENEEAEVFP